PARRCAEYEEWKSVLDPDSVGLLFAAGYLNNPSTLYGHTFLRLHKKGGEGADLLDYTVNYAAAADEGLGVLFAVKGLVGAYPGRFSTIPYYLKIQEYHNMENRDLWEFPLDLTAEEIDRLLRHSWELGKAAFPYRFFTRNCSWQLMPLLDIVRPGRDLVSRFHFWVIPSDTARAAAGTAVPAAPLWRPSLWKTVDWKRSFLSRSEKGLVLRLSRGDQSAGLSGLEALPPDRRAAVLETAADYLNWRYYARRIKKDDLDRRTAPLLAERAALGDRPTFAGAPPRPPSIMDAHESMRLGAGAVALKNGPAYDLQVRFALQDLLDDPEGYMPNAALEMGALRLRYQPRENRLFVKEGTLTHVVSLNPWDDWVRARSWQIKAGVEQADETGRAPGSSAIWAMGGGSGYAVETRWPLRQVYYALAVADTGFGPALRASWRAGA
ncbi:MAG TPA: DUF4105 domain-containing protein, partial [Elusimicrobiales bacterium]|nr:DUF4105 domain-containing protein [Elusimicrobiales bacterium]